LREVLHKLAGGGGLEVELQSGDSVVCPVLLPIDGAAGGLSVGASGECSRDYLVSLRNTPSGKRWVALMAPGSHDAKSVTGATDEFGINAVNNGGTASVDAWMEDAFVAGLIDRAVERQPFGGDGERKSARAASALGVEAIGTPPAVLLSKPRKIASAEADAPVEAANAATPAHRIVWRMG
jgi:hypothetical protein